MLSQHLYEFLFSGENLPAELKDKERLGELSDQLNLYVTTIRYKHRILLQQARMITDKLYFVEYGLVRGYTFDVEQGKEKTISLWPGRTLMTDPNSLIYQMESDIYIEVFPHTELSYISRHHLEALSDSFPCIKSLLSWLIKNDVLHSNKRLLDKSIPAWDRLVEMKKIYPQLDQMVSRTIIASFLNISPQHLSKIVRDNIKK